MAVQTVDGYAAMYEDIRRWSRTTAVAGAVSEDTVADAINEAQEKIQDIVIESGVPWATRNKTIDDIGGNLGTQIEENVYRLFMVTDLAITDMARVRRIWRVPDDPSQGRGARVTHLDMVGPSVEVGEGSGQVFADERWAEDGDYNDDGIHEMAIVLYNRGNALAGGLLKVNYWFSIPDITADTFVEEDADGNRTVAPPLPRLAWRAITNYAKLIILETTGDDFRRNALWARLHGPAGVLERLRMKLSAFQTGDASYVDDGGMEAG